MTETPHDRAVEQDRRAAEEDTAAHEAVTDADAHAHARRADKAAYLRDKLAEQDDADGS